MSFFGKKTQYLNLITTIQAVVVISIFLYLTKPTLAAWNGSPYQTGETLNPECNPSQTSCTVVAPLSSSGNSNLFDGSLSITPSSSDPAGLVIHPFGEDIGATGELRLTELAANGANYTGFKSPDSLGSNIVYTLPNVSGTNNQVLSTNGNGALSWATMASGGTSAIGQSVSGSSGLGILFTDANGVLTQDATNFNYDPTGDGKLTVKGTIDPKAFSADDFSGGAGAYYEAKAGQNAAVASAGAGRLRYNALTNQFEISENGGTYNALKLTGSQEQITTFDSSGRQIAAPSSGLSIVGDVSGTLGATSVDKLKGAALTLTSLSANNLLQYNGTNWVNVTPASLGSIALAIGTSGTDVGVSGTPAALGGMLTLNIPDASETARGLVTTGAQTIAGNKTFNGDITVAGNIIPATGEIYDLGSLDKPFRTLYINGSSIMVDGVRLSNNSGVLNWAGQAFRLRSTTSASSELALTEMGDGDPDTDENTLTLKAPESLDNNLVLVLPDNAGANGQVLKTDGTGALSWVTPLTETITSLNSLTGSVQLLATGTSGTNFNIASSGNTHTFNIPDASSSARGFLTNSDWTVFNNKVSISRQILAGAGLSGGGDLSADRTLALDLNGLSSVSSVGGSDYLPVYLAGSSEHKKISYNDLFSSVLGSLNYRGTWNASTNNPSLNDTFCSTGTKGYYYVVSTAGVTTLGGISTWNPNDWAICNGSDWQRMETTNYVASVFGRLGTVTAQAGDYTASQITSIPAGNLSATNVQAALNELDGEKITSLNGLAANTQTFALGTSGADANISSNGSVHTFNIPDASASARGLVTKDAQTFGGDKTFMNNLLVYGDTASSLTIKGANNTVGTPVATLNLVAPSMRAKGIKFGADVSGSSNYWYAGVPYSTLDGRFIIGYGTSPHSSAVLNIVSSGNVGIGTVPSAKLHTASNEAVSGFGQLLISGETDGNKQLRIGYDTTSNYAFIRPIRVGSEESNLILNPYGANVGIGITSPGAKLDVAGDLQLRAQGDLRLADSDSSNYVALQAPSTISSNVTWTLPAADGTGGQVISTNGSGVLGWSLILTPTLTSGNIFVGNPSNIATARTLSGDATISNMGSLTLADSGVTAGSYGGAAQIPVLTVDGKGRVTAASTSAITRGNVVSDNSYLLVSGGTNAVWGSGVTLDLGTGAITAPSNPEITITGGTGAVLGGGVAITIPDASTTTRGLVTTGAQNFSGLKNFTGGVTVAGSASFSTALNMNSNKIINLAAPTSPNDAANKAYIDALTGGVIQQKPVLDLTGGSAPSSPNSGDRYILQDGAAEFGSCQTNQIAQWDGSTWVCDGSLVGTGNPSNGWTTNVAALGQNYSFNGTDWVAQGTTVSHLALINLQGGAADEYYHLNLNDYDALTAGTAQLTALQTSGSPVFAGLTITGTTKFNGITYTWPATQAAGRVLSTNGSGTLSWIPALTSDLASSKIFVGNGAGEAAAVNISGDATLANTGALTIASGVITSAKIADGTIVNADVNASANIALSKLAGGNNIVTSLAAPSGSNANAGSIANNSLTLAFADKTNPGIISTGAQTLGGIKTFDGVLFNEAADAVLGFNYPDTTYDRRLRLTAGKTDTADNSQGASIDLHGNDLGGNLDLVAGGIDGVVTMWTNNGQQMIVDTTGNVGIGTADPAEKLDVVGNLRLSTATAAQDQLLIKPNASGPNRFAGTLTSADLTAAATWTLPNVSGTIYTSGNDPLDTISEWQTLCTNCADIVNDTTGTLTLSRGGTGLTTAPANGQLLIGNGTGYTLAALTGTTNQISVAGGAGTITLSTPQNIHSAASPTFAGMTISGLGTGIVHSTSGALSSSQIVNADIASSTIDLTTKVSGILPVVNGGTGTTTLNNLITLSTHTTGNYAAGNTAGTGIAISGIAGEGWSPTIAVASTVPIAVSNDTNITGALASNTLTLGWTGQLGIARGGTNITTYAAGDLLYASAANTLAKKVIGSNGQVLTVSGGVPTWSAPSACPTCFVNNGNSFGTLAVLGTNDNQSLAFETNNTERVRITNDGNVGIGIADPTEKLDMIGNMRLQAQGDLRLADADSSNFVALQAPSTVAANVTLTLPSSAGSIGQMLSTDGSGILSWTTPLTTAITSLNGLTASSQTFATGTTGTDFNIASSGNAHTFNIPSASATTRGLVTTDAQTFAGNKTFSGAATFNNLVTVNRDGSSVLVKAVTAGKGSYLDFQNSDNSVRGLFGVDGDGFTGAAGQFSIATWTNHPMVFLTNTAERMRITNAGNVGIGTSSPEHKFNVVGTGTSAWVAGISNTSNAENAHVLRLLGGQNTPTSVDGDGYITSGASHYVTFARPDGAVIGSIRQDSASSILIADTSDARLKTNITDSLSGLETIKNIQVRDFAYRDDPNKAARQGFIAQELYNVYPQAVSVGGDDPRQNPWGVDYGKLTPLLVKSVQELSYRTQSLNIENDQSIFTGTVYANNVDGLSQLVSSLNSSIQPTQILPADILDTLQQASAVKLSGKLLVQGDSTFEGVVTLINQSTFKNTASFLADVNFAKAVVFKNDVLFKGRLAFEDQDMAGYVKIASGRTEVKVVFEKEYSFTPIIQITPLGKYDTKYWVADVTSKGFSVKIDPSLAGEAQFTWSALAVKDPRTAESEPGTNPSDSQPADGSQPTPSPSSGPTAEPTEVIPSPSPMPATAAEETREQSTPALENIEEEESL